MADIILLFCFLSLKDSIFENGKNVFHFISKAVFILFLGLFFFLEFLGSEVS